MITDRDPSAITTCASDIRHGPNMQKIIVKVGIAEKRLFCRGFDDSLRRERFSADWLTRRKNTLE
jgi:hypothetical protein